MVKAAFPSTPGQVAVTVDDIDDPATVNAGIELLDQDAVTLQSQALRARRVTVRLGACVVLFHSCNLHLRTRTSAMGGLLAYVAFGPRARGTVNGLPVRPGMMLAVAPETEVTFVVDPGWEAVAFLLPPPYLGAHLAVRQREREFRMPQGVEPLHVDEARSRQLYDWGKRLVDSAVLDPALFNESESERAAAQADLLDTLLATLDVADKLEPSRIDRTRQAQSLIVKLAEDYALAQTGASVYVTDLCKAAGVSERTLEYAFKAVMGLTPMAYLSRLRLHRVRQALLAAPAGSTTVSTEALRWGFWHFGEFSRAYRECFGELPSDTLRREPRPPGTPKKAATPLRAQAGSNDDPI
jgi:AraC-like DNA-binding protein